jgi:hypothetical protein
MPGYRIVGINCNQMIPALGAIHCITKEVSSKDPLWIVHQPLADQSSSTPAYTVNATIRHLSGIASAEVYYRTDTLLPYTAIAMSPSVGSPDTWTADIPAQPAGSTVYYYIHASATSGKSINRPLPAPAGYWHFNVDISTGVPTAVQSVSVGNLFPNPSRGWTVLQTNATKPQLATVALNNLMGQHVLDVFNGTIPEGGKNIWFDTSALPSGIYLLEVSTASGSEHRRLVVR